MTSFLSVLSSVAFLVFATVVTATSPYQACNSELGVVNDVRVSDCSSAPCILKRGGSVSLEVDFTLNSDVTSAKDSVYGIIHGLHLPFPTSSPNACDPNKGLSCPLKKGIKYTYKSQIPISSIFPSLSVVVEWSLVEGSKKLFCIQIPSKLQ